jgi:hypothetical protein
MATYIKAGNGFDVGQDFNRVMVDTPITLAPTEYARPGNVIGYIAGNPASNLGFMRAPRVRVHMRRQYSGGEPMTRAQISGIASQVILRWAERQSNRYAAGIALRDNFNDRFLARLERALECAGDKR